jgi:hypothetical protein
MRVCQEEGRWEGGQSAGNVRTWRKRGGHANVRVRAGTCTRSRSLVDGKLRQSYTPLPPSLPNSHPPYLPSRRVCPSEARFPPARPGCFPRPCPVQRHPPLPAEEEEGRVGGTGGVGWDSIKTTERSHRAFLTACTALKHKSHTFRSLPLPRPPSLPGVWARAANCIASPPPASGLSSRSPTRRDDRQTPSLPPRAHGMQGPRAASPRCASMLETPG